MFFNKNADIVIASRSNGVADYFSIEQNRVTVVDITEPSRKPVIPAIRL